MTNGRQRAYVTLALAVVALLLLVVVLAAVMRNA